MRPLFLPDEIPCSLGQIVRPPGTGLRCHANLGYVFSQFCPYRHRVDGLMSGQQLLMSESFLVTNSLISSRRESIDSGPVDNSLSVICRSSCSRSFIAWIRNEEGPASAAVSVKRRSSTSTALFRSRVCANSPESLPKVVLSCSPN